MDQPSCEAREPQAAAWLHGGGEMGARMRAFAWERTPLGPPETWPQSLRTTVSTCLNSRFPILVWWGPQLVKLYNDSYRRILVDKHPRALGMPGREVWPEIWHLIGPMLEGVMQRGEATWSENILLPLERNGFPEECYFTFSYSPIRDEHGGIGGVFTAVTETTAQVLGQRRLRSLHVLSEQTLGASELAVAREGIRQGLAANAQDIPCAALYLLEDDTAKRVVAHGLTDEAPAQLPARRLRAWAAREQVPASELPELAPAPGVAAPRAWAALPMSLGGGREGLLLCGLSPMLAYDGSYRSFLATFAKQVGAALEAARAAEETRRRAEELAALDRAKTAFFSNVSHEFRTPLTLMLGPLEQALQGPSGALAGEDLAAVHRNALRLLKLVNSLLDFARIEAGRMEASFEPVALDELTRDLASTFRSMVERAGLTLEVECQPLGAPVYVDRGMWEKIVLNLLSNAFKHTLEGGIRVRLRAEDGRARLDVDDTGVGIAPEEQPRIFERFHRVQGAKARSFEGAGIGLALVQELVRMHGGAVSVRSALGQGSTFEVSIPLGRAHLSADRVATPVARAARPASAGWYVQEAEQWDRGGQEPSGRDASLAGAWPGLAGVRVLVVDDNRDMREYLGRLLRAHCEVVLAADGQEALELASEQSPTVVLTDAMMPGLDGFGLIRELRAREATHAVPVLMLSARAGEEARLDGLRAGVDDYLVKPFSVRELLGRLEALVVKARLRELEVDQSRRLSRILKNAPVGIAVLRGPEHRFEAANQDYVRTVGGRVVVGKTIREAFPDLEGQGIYELLDAVYRTGEPYVGRSVRLVLDEPAGPREGFFDFVYQPDRDAAGRIEGIVVVVFETTELSRARQDAEAASRAKDQFLAVLGHELRNPLAPIVTTLAVMRRRGVGEQERFVSIMERQVSHLTRLVDDLLDVSRVAGGKIELQREQVELAEIINRSLEQVRELAASRQQRLWVDVPPRGLPVNADVTRLAQVVTNLVVNAIKHNPSGRSIEIEARREQGSVVVCVRDDGVGIAPELLPDLFDMFVQGPQAPDRARGGLGLGLAIVKGIVQLHGGTVEARSAGVDRGSEFVVRLPVAPGASAALVQAESPEAGVRRAGKLLIVDDNVDAAEVLAEFVESLGLQTFVAHDGEAGFELLQKVRPDVALLDLGLPGMSGMDLARLIRKDAGQAPKLIAITGYGQELDRRAAFDAGFDAHLTKPVRPDDIVRLIESMLEQKSA